LATRGSCRGPEINFYVQFGGRTESYYDQDFRYRVRWIPDRMVKGVAYDTPIPGYRVGMTNQLRLWKAEAVESFDFAAFNTGDYDRAVLDKITSENLTKVLYPNDNISQGKQLRLEQQYFFVSCSLRDMDPEVPQSWLSAQHVFTTSLRCR
jgi:starch phosphorylase